jgi:hypothetical protein
MITSLHSTAQHSTAQRNYGVGNTQRQQVGFSSNKPPQLKNPTNAYLTKASNEWAEAIIAGIKRIKARISGMNPSEAEKAFPIPQEAKKWDGSKTSLAGTTEAQKIQSDGYWINNPYSINLSKK